MIFLIHTQPDPSQLVSITEKPSEGRREDRVWAWSPVVRDIGGQNRPFGDNGRELP